MGKFISVSVNGVRKYESISKLAFKKIDELGNVLKFEKVMFVGSFNKLEIYFDNKDNLLSKAGVVVSKVIEGNKAYFKIQRQSFIPSTFKDEDKIYIHEIGLKDKVKDHTFYITDGIKELYTTSFSIDLENVVKNIYPKLIVKTKIQRNRIVSGTGFRAILDKEEIKITNRQTHRTVKKLGATLKMDCGETYLKQFTEQAKNIEKYVKELLPINETEYDYVNRITKPLPKKEKVDKKKEKAKQNKIT